MTWKFRSNYIRAYKIAVYVAFLHLALITTSLIFGGYNYCKQNLSLAEDIAQAYQVLTFGINNIFNVPGLSSFVIFVVLFAVLSVALKPKEQFSELSPKEGSVIFCFLPFLSIFLVKIQSIFLLPWLSEVCRQFNLV